MTMASDVERYNFEAEWYDKISYTLKKFYLYFYPSDNSVELFDLKTRKTFLRRSKCEGIEAKDFYVGAVVTIFSRCMKITNFADQTTKDKLSSKIVRNHVLLKPNVIDKMGEILKQISDFNFFISNIKMGKINHEDAKQITKLADYDMTNVMQCLTSGPVVALELLTKDGTSRWQELKNAFEKSGVDNGIYELGNKEQAQCFFPLDKRKICQFKSSAKFQNCTCCIIKPHAVQANLIGPIVYEIQKANFIISAIQQFYFDPVNAEEFLEVYKNVLPDYAAMVGELQSGPCVALEIRHGNENTDVVSEFRKFCGPIDPEMAKELRPNTLRALFGKTKIQNAVHCSDLPEDGLLEVEYFFKILENN